MKAKSTYTLSMLDAELAGGGKQTTAEAKSAAPVPPANASPPKPVAKSTAQKWATQTKPDPGAQTDMPTLEPGPSVAMLEPLPPEEAGYTIDEIREISRGFFGTISTELGSVIEYAFSSAGRPDGYVLGTEGGGAFLAGVRYGSGTYYMRSGGSGNIYWHGPSIGTDFGASGSRTMFLIYRLHQPEELYRQFTGVDGSAYFIGGVGITLPQGRSGDHGADPYRPRPPARRQHRLHPLHAATDLEPVLTQPVGLAPATRCYSRRRIASSWLSSPSADTRTGCSRRTRPTAARAAAAHSGDGVPLRRRASTAACRARLRG